MSKEKEKPGEAVFSSETLEGRVKDADKMDAVMAGFEIKSLPIGTKFAIKTESRTYILEHRTDGWYISGHPEHCPNPTKVEISGSTWGASAYRPGYIGRGMRLEYRRPGIDPTHTAVTTTPVIEIRPVTDAPEGKVN